MVQALGDLGMARHLRHALLGSTALVGIAIANPAAAQTVFVGAGQTFEVANGQTVSNSGSDAISAGADSQIIVRPTGQVLGGGNGITYDSGTLVNEGTVQAAGTAAYFFGSGNVVNSGTLRSTGGPGVRYLNGGTITNYGTITTPSFGFINQGAAGTITNYGTITTINGNNAPIYNTATAPFTVNLMAGSVTSNPTAFAAAIQNTQAGTTLTMYTGVGSTDPGVTVGGTQYVAPGARNAAQVTGFIRLTGGGNTINLAGNGTGANDTGQAGTLSLSQLENVNTINKVDSGTWTLTGTPSFSGGVAINVGTSGADGGRLIFSGGGAIGTITVANGTIRATSPGTFGANQIQAGTGAVEFGFTGTYTNAIQLLSTGTGAFTLRADPGVNATLSGAITQAANRDLSFAGGTLTLTGTNNWTGNTTIQSGTTLVGNRNSISGTAIANSGLLIYDQASNAGSATQAITGTGNLTKRGTGALTLGAGSTYSGVTTVQAGTLAVNDADIGSSSAVTLSGGTLRLIQGAPNGSTPAPPSTVRNLSGNGQLLISSKGTVLTNTTNTVFSGTLTGYDSSSLAPTLPASVTKAGSGTLTLTGDSPNISTLIVNAGTLALGNGGTTGSVGPATAITVNAGGVLQLNRSDSFTLNELRGSGTVNKLGANGVTLSSTVGFAGQFNINAGSVTLSRTTALAGATVTLSEDTALNNTSNAVASIGALSGVGGTVNVGAGLAVTGGASRLYGGLLTSNAGGNLIQQGIGTLTLTADQANFGGDFRIDSGTLAFAGAAQAANSNVLMSNGTFNIADVNGDTVQIGGLGGTGGLVRLGDKTLEIQGNVLSFGGAIVGEGGLVLTNNADLTLLGANDYTGDTVVQEGAVLRLEGDRLLSSVYLDGSLEIGAGSHSIQGLNGSGTVELVTSQGAAELVVEGISSFGGLVTAQATNASTLRVAGGLLQLSGGVEVSNLVVDDFAELDLTGSFDVGAIDVGAEGTLLFAPTLDRTFAGVLSGSGAVSKAGDATLTMDGVNSYAGTFTVEGGTLAIGANGSLATTDLVLDGGNLDISAGEHDSQLATLNAATGTVTLGGNTLTLANGGTIGARVTGSGGLALNNGELAVQGGTLTLTNADNDYGATTVGANATLVVAGQGTVGTGRVTADGIVDLSNSNRSMTFGSLSGNGSVVLGLTDLTLGSDGTDSSFGGVISGFSGIIKVGQGVLTLSGANTYTGLTDVTAGTLRLGASGVLADSSALVVRNGATMDLNGFDERVARFDIQGNLIGAGTLSAQDFVLRGGTIDHDVDAGTITVTEGTTVFNGAVSGDPVTIEGGTLQLGASERLDNDATLTIQDGGTLDLAGFNETVGTAAIAGTLAGTGTLTAATYTLNGAQIDANLGAGALTQQAGSSVLNGTSGAANVAISGGTLALGSANRLSDTAAVTVGTGATLALGTASDTVGSAAIAGSVTGSGTLTAATYTLTGATIDANLGTGALTQASGRSTLNGTSGASTVELTGGTLAIGGSNRLSDTAAVTVGSGSTLDLAAFNDTVGSATIGGTLTGTGTLTAATTTLNGATVNANLGAGTLNQASGSSTLAGTSGAGTVNVTGGTLALGAADRLSDTAALTVGTGGTLNLAGFNDTVGSATLGGTLSGTGTLTAATTTLNGATVNANLGAGTLTQASGSSTLAGTSGAGTVNVTAGTLALGAADRLSDTAALTVGTGGTLNLAGFNETVGSATLGGTVNGTGTLTAGTTTLNGATVNANLGAGTLTQASGTSTLNGASGASTVAVNGGTLAVGANGSLANGVAVTTTAGTLDLSAGNGTAALGSLAGTGGTVALGGRSASLAQGGTYGGTVTGTGGLTIASGTEVLTGNNSYTGATVLTGASNLTLGNGGTSGAVAGAIQTGTGVVTLNRSDAVTIAGAISGGGSLVQAGTGTTTLTGANSYTGGTTVSAGTLVGNVASIRGDVQNAGRVVFAQAGDGSFAGATRGTGSFGKTGAGNLTLTGTSAANWTVDGGTLTSASSRFTGNAAIGTGATLTFDQSGAGSYAGTLSGAGAFTVRGGTQLILTGNSSGFTGTTTVGDAGGANMLSVNGTLGGTLNVLSGGRLQGSGTIGNASVAGTVAPGNSIGTLNVAGNFAFAAGSTYEVEANAAGQSDRIVASGAATIGANVGVRVLAADGNYAVNTSYTILSAAGGITGTFATVTSNLAFLAPTLTYGTTSVTLNLRRNTVDFATVAQTGNQRAIAPSVQAIGLGNGVYDAVVALTAAEARGAFDQLAGSDYASLRGSMLEDSRFVRDSVLSRGAMAGETGVSIWGTALGSWGDMDGDANALGYDRDVKGFVTGFDGSLGENLRVGVALGYDSTKFRTARATQDVDGYHAGGYVVGGAGIVSFTAGAAYAWNDVSASRRVTFGTLNQGLSANYDARTFQAFGEVALKADLGGIALQPFAGVAHVTLFDADINERGGSGALHGGTSNERVTFGTLGLRTKIGSGSGDTGVRFVGSAAVRHAFGDRVPTVDLGFATGPAFTVAGTAIEKNSIAADAGLQADLSRNVTFGVSYVGNYGKRSTDHGGRASLSFRF
jgi:fibronectin-binding autotransporter adhesin